MSFPGKRNANDDLQREVEHHLHQLAAGYERQGYSKAESLLLAKREFGGTEQFKEQTRDEWRFAWLTGLKQDIVFGLRMMRKTPMITVAAILSLALGIGANTGIAALMDMILWRSLPVPNAKQLALVHWEGRGFPRDLADAGAGSMRPGDSEGAPAVADFFSYPAYEAFQKAVADHASIAAYRNGNQVSLSYQGQPSVAILRPVSGNFFATLQVRPQLGRLLLESDDQPAAEPSVVLTSRFWSKALGADPGVLGRTITIDQTPFTIAGVLEPSFYGLYPGDHAEIYVTVRRLAPLEQQRGERDLLKDNRFWGTQLIARLSPRTTLTQLRPMMETTFRSTWSRQPADESRAPRLRLDDGARGLGSLRREFRNPLYVLGGLVGLLLVIACVNIANLLLVRAVARRKEVAMRLSLGCSRARLMRQFLTESALMAVLGGAVSILFAYATANLLGQYVADYGTIALEVGIDYRILSIAGALTVATLVLFGIFPAWQASSSSNAAFLKEGAGSIGNVRRRWNTGRALVVAQVAMSVILVTAGVIFSRNLLSIQASDPGFERRNMVLFDVRPGTSGYSQDRLVEFYRNLEERIASTPGVTAAAIAGMRPMNVGGWWEQVQVSGSTERFQASLNGVTPSYLPLYAGPMVAGRNVSWNDINSEAKVAVISEDLARRLGGAGVLGQRLSYAGGPPGSKPPQYEIVGIAPAVAATSLKQRPYAVWFPLGKGFSQATILARTAQSPNAVLPSIRQTVAGIDRNLPLVDVVTMEEQIAKTLQRERMFATLSGGFAALALTLSVVGLYGVIAYSTSRRKNEIGVRLALGAMPGQVLRMVLREGLTLATLGIVLGAPLVLFGAKYVEKELWQAKALEPAPILLTLGILLASAFLAVMLPALRAAGLKPADTLRQE